jgi:hypothetical protein
VLATAKGKLEACARDAPRRLRRGPLEGTGTLHLETDDVGVVRRASVKGGLPPELGDCVARAVAGARIRSVDTGIATADVPLAYRLP